MMRWRFRIGLRDLYSAYIHCGYLDRKSSHGNLASAPSRISSYGTIGIDAPLDIVTPLSICTWCCSSIASMLDHTSQQVTSPLVGTQEDCASNTDPTHSWA